MNAHNGLQKSNLRHKMALNGLESLMEIVGLEM